MKVEGEAADEEQSVFLPAAGGAHGTEALRGCT